MNTIDLQGKAAVVTGGARGIGLACALIAKPPLLLLDEPLSNLDAKLRERMRLELKRLQSELGITSVYVTHDQSEALALSHRIAVMSEGRIVQAGTPREIYERPEHNFVAEFVGTTNFISGEALGPAEENSLQRIRAPHGDLDFPSGTVISSGTRVTLSIRPEHVQVGTQPSTGPNACKAVVETQVFHGFYQDLVLRVGGTTLLARTHPSVPASPGATVYLTIDPAYCVVCR